MHLTVTGHHTDVTQALRDYVATRFDKLQRHFDQLVDVHCVLTVEKLIHRAEATIRLGGGKIHAEAAHNDMYTAIDELAHKLDRQVTKHKEKVTDHRAREVEKRYG